jgi:hypothetical protein
MYGVSTLEDIEKSIAKHGEENILEVNVDKIRSNKPKGNSKTPLVYYITIQLKLENGKLAPCKFKFVKVATATRAKIRKGTEDDVKYVQVGFSELSIEEIMIGDLAPRIIESAEEQEIENNRAQFVASKIKISTDKFMRCLKALHKSYLKVVGELLEKAKRKEIKINTTKKDTIISFVQESFKDEETDELKQMEHPIAWLKLSLNSNKELAVDTWSKKEGTFISTHNVYDASKKDKRGNPVLATYSEDGPAEILNKDNVHNFITKRSLISGVMEFRDIVTSGFGINIKGFFQEVFVKSNSKTSETNTSFFTSEELKDIQGDAVVDDINVEKITKEKIENEVSDNVSELGDYDDQTISLEFKEVEEDDQSE